MIDQLTYIDFAIIGLVTALGLLIVISKDVIRVLVSFMTLLFVVGGVFLLFGSGFLFVTQILIYVGGVTILLIFSIMLSKRFTKDQNLISLNQNVIIGVLVTLGLGGCLLFIVNQSKIKELKSVEIDEVKGLGTELMSKYLFAFELLAVFLLIALILAAVIAGKKSEV